MESIWIKTTTDVKTINLGGKTIVLHNVPALKDKRSNKIYIDPADVSTAEINQLAKEYSLIGRHIPLLLLLYAKSGPFEIGVVHYQYHLNKMLFYLWNNLKLDSYDNAFPHDEMIPEKKGPVPKNIIEDLKQLQERSLISTRYHQWGVSEKHSSKEIKLTKEGIKIAKKLWESMGDIFKEEILQTKESIFPLEPETVKKKVHREFPEYRLSYIEEDVD